MSKTEVMELIKQTAERHGFKCSTEFGDVVIRDGMDWGKHWVLFTIHCKSTFNEANKESDATDYVVVTRNVKVTATVSRMGGNQTVEDLLTASDIIRRAAELVRELDGMSLSYVLSLND